MVQSQARELEEHEAVVGAGVATPAANGSVRGWSASVVALVVVGLLLEAVWVAVDGLAMCANETPGYQRLLAEAAPWLPGFDQRILDGLITLVPAVGGGSDGCNQASLGWLLGGAGLIFLVGVWLLDRTPLPGRWTAACVVGFSALFAVTLMAMPALLSSDALDYATHGRVSGVYGANPYVATPRDFPPDPISASGGWSDVPTVYGPLWSRIEGQVAALEAVWDPVGQLALFKLLAIASYFASVGLLWWLARRWASLGLLRGSVPAAVALFAWNPLVVFELVGNAHNESLTVALMLLGLVPITRVLGTPGALVAPRSRAAWLLSLAILTLGTLVKFFPAVLGGMVLLGWLACASTVGSRIRRAAAFAAMALGIAVLVAWPWLDSPAVLGPIIGIAAGGQRYTYAWQDAVATRIDVRILAHIGVPFPDREPLSRAITWGVLRAAFAVWAAWEMWRLLRSARLSDRALVRSIAASACRLLVLAVLVVSTQVLPWYYVWAVPLGTLLGWRSLTAKASVMFGLTFLSAYYLREFVHYPTDQMPIYVEVALAALVAAWLWGSFRNGGLWTPRDGWRGRAPGLAAPRAR